MNSLVEYLQVFLLNLFFVFILFLIFHMFIEKKINAVSNKISIGFLSSISILLCMTFPISPFPNFLFDLRQVPFIIGALYGGRKVALFILFVILSYRFVINLDTGFYATLIIYTLLYLVLYSIIPCFKKSVKIIHKILISLIANLMGLLLIGTVVYLLKPDIKMAQVYILFILYGTQLIGVGLFVAFIEKTRAEVAILNELKKFEKLRVVSDIAASISHEVRNPLTVTKGFLQLLKDPEITEEKKEFYINLSLEELERAENIISDYLTLAKPSLENITIIDLSEEIEYVIKVVTPYASLNNSLIEFIPKKSIYVLGEKQKLHQCFINIVKNGIESMPKGGTITIVLKETINNAYIVIQDTGIGMNKDQMNRLGTPYYSTKEKGTGLGTMVVYSIIKMLEGKIKVESEEGKGTRFTISLPKFTSKNVSEPISNASMSKFSNY